MAFPQMVSVSATTDGSGNATVYTEAFRGRINAVQYVKTDFADGVDFTITTETSAQNVWVDTNINAAEVVQPRIQSNDTAGVLISGAYDAIRVYNERVKIIVGSGGDTKTGTFRVFLE